MTDTSGLIKTLSQVRLVDVVDALDYIGIRDAGLISAEIRPIYEGIKICGPAKTVRCIPTRRPIVYKTPEEYEQIRQEWYASICPAFGFDDVQEGDVLVATMEGAEVGFWGSYNGLIAQARKVSGVVLDGGCRDRRELKVQKTPVFARKCARTETIGRFEQESVNKTVVCGGVQVRVGDIVFGDDDGLAVVPIERLSEVTKLAKEVHELDKRNRGEWYRKMGISPDDTVV